MDRVAGRPRRGIHECDSALLPRSLSYHVGISASPEEAKAGIAGGFDRAALTYDTVIPFFQTFAEQLVDCAALQPGQRVLDVACGRGACLRSAARRVGASGYVLGVDLSRTMVDLARQDLADLDRPPGAVDVRVGDGEHLDLTDDSFDVVLCGFGVFFFPDPAAALSEFRRVLRGGGLFASSTFVGGGGGYPWIGDVIREVRPATPTLAPSPVSTGKGLINFLRGAGFVEANTRQVEASFVFPDVDAYLAWNWSTGTRRLLETFSDEESKTYRRASADRLEAHAVSGGYELIQRAEVTVATNPGGSIT